MVLQQTEEVWQVLEIRGYAKTVREVFYYGGDKWRHASPGDMVFGYVLGRDVAVVTVRILD